MSQPNWCKWKLDSPLSLILKRLTRNEIICLRGVCQSLRFTIPIPCRPYKDFKLPSSFSNDDHSCHLVVTLTTIYAIQPRVCEEDSSIIISTPAPAWIVRVEKLSTGQVQVWDTLNSRRRNMFSDDLPRYLNLWDYQVKEISKAYELQIVESDIISEPAKAHEIDEQNDAYTEKFPIFLRKVAVSPCPDYEDYNYPAVMIISGGQLFLCRADDAKNWIKIRIDDDTDHEDKISDNKFEDVVYFRNKFYAVASPRRVVTIDPKTVQVNEVKYGFDCYMPVISGQNYLVTTSNDLFWICNCWAADSYLEDSDDDDDDDLTADLFVVKLDEEKCKWVEVEDDLKDSVLFAGDDCSFSISDKHFSAACLLNHIYFRDEDDIPTGCRPGRDVTNFEVGASCAAQSLGGYPAYCQIFWPPPAWLN